MLIWLLFYNLNHSNKILLKNVQIQLNLLINKKQNIKMQNYFFILNKAEKMN